jgi:hypothetical protein
MTLKNLEGLTLEAITPDRMTIQRLLDAVARSLSDARLSKLSAEGRFDMAYKAIMQSANTALQANGYRTLTSKPGHHQTMIQTLVHSIGLDRREMVTLDGLRKQRNVIDYSGDVVSESMANECLVHAEALSKRVYLWLKNNAPDLL